MDKPGAQRETEAGNVALGCISLELVFKDFGREDLCQGECLERRELRTVQEEPPPLMEQERRHWKGKRRKANEEDRCRTAGRPEELRWKERDAQGGSCQFVL